MTKRWYIEFGNGLGVRSFTGNNKDLAEKLLGFLDKDIVRVYHD